MNSATSIRRNTNFISLQSFYFVDCLFSIRKEKEVQLEIDKHNSNHRLFNNCKGDQKKQERGKENWRKKKKKKRINLR